MTKITKKSKLCYNSNVNENKEVRSPSDQKTTDALVSSLEINGTPVRLSSSGADKFNQCKRSWYSRYVLGEKDTPSESSMMGTYVYSALEDFYNGTERSVENLKLQASSGWGEFVGEYTREFKGGRSLSSREEEELRAAVWNALDGIAHMEDPSKVNVIESEMAIDMHYRGLPFRGFIDRVDQLPDGTQAIVDFKTGKAPQKAQYFSDKLRQILLYGWALREMDYNPSVGKLLYTTHKTTIQTDINDKAIEKVLNYLDRTIDDMHEAAETMEFPPSPSPLCGWCPLSANGCDEGKNTVLSMGRLGRLRFDAPAFKWIDDAERAELPPPPEDFYLTPNEEEFR